MRRKRAVSVVYIIKTKKSKVAWTSHFTLIVSAARFALAQRDCNGVQLDDTCSYPYRQPHIRIGGAASKPCWRLTNPSNMAPTGWFWHSIPSPSHWDLGSPGFSRGTASRRILLCEEPAWHAGREHSGSVGWSRETWGHEWTLASSLHWQIGQHSSYCT